MDKLSINLKNCFGIKSLSHEFDFSDGNVYGIYARNGVMKTSLTKTFERIQKNKVKEIADVIFNEPGIADIKIDGNNITPEDVFVIKSLDTSYESDISSLLVKEDIRTRLKDTLKARDAFLKAIEKSSGIKIKKTSGGKTVYELEQVLVHDFGFPENSILVNAEMLSLAKADILFTDISYANIFDATVLKKIKSSNFQNSIQNFIAESDRVYNSFEFLAKGNLTLPKLKDIKKALVKNSFFVKQNGIILTGEEHITNEQELDERITAIETAVKELKELTAIEDMLSDSKGIILRDIIETHPEIIPYLMIDQLDELKKILWISYIKVNRSLFDDMLTKYQDFSNAIDTMSLDNTLWKQALDIFKKRFSVPFEMEISNLKGAMIGESIPQVVFSFKKEDRKIKINRERLRELDTLSQGEKRALYLLNIVFDLERIKNEGKEVLVIVDDIADSFDYKNKYAIIEYLFEMSENEHIKMLLLSHNYDFYRTASSRIDISYNHRLFAKKNNDGLTLVTEQYHNQPFQLWKKEPNKIYILAMIPFVRNIVEYGKDWNISNTKSDFHFLTALLHEKEQTSTITFSDLLPIYRYYANIQEFHSDINLDNSVVDALYEECDKIIASSSTLEYKIILAMGIRHRAEKFMKNKIRRSKRILTWNRGKISGHGKDFLTYIEHKSNQTRELMNGYNQIGNEKAKKVILEVSIMTPENIHFNAFMYEPIMDMDIIELLRLYQDVKSLK